MTTDENENSGNPEGRPQAHAHGYPQERGAWQPIPQGGEYDGESTAFVQLPPEDRADAPLAAPGHGYVPPAIDQRQPDGGVAPGGPADVGQWAPHTPQTQPDPYGYGQGHGQGYGQGHPHGYHPDVPHDPQATGQWSFADPAGGGADARTEPEPPSPAQPTGQWVIPVVPDDLTDESGEFTTSVPITSQWSGGAPPATLPGGARAPWATEPEPAPEPVAEQPPQAAPDEAEAPAHATGPDTDEQPGAEAPSETGAEADAATETDVGTAAETEPAPGAQNEPVPEPEPEPEPLTSSNDSAEHPAGSYVLRVNGADRPVTDAWIGESLLYVLRERLGLAGAKDGCSQGECGACNVQVDGRLVASCLVPAATAAGSEVRTVEGLASDGEPSDVQRALANCGAVQCGFCIPGMAMTVHDLLEGNHDPSELETRQALSGNLCRCSGYRGVLDAVGEVVAERAASAEAADEARIPHQAPPGAGGAHPAPLDPHDGGKA
ncbi:2Fe-2S iron-sulfur cluster-binding protein [Streptomyces sp. NP-1717]|uniref:2Fe-2S iron-sulfur cluster-binding protein n=1 Tax=Streptomyces sp. NP-1717 TaxID=2704470 RepID=UPI0035B4D28B|nr:(2Fe-2S)-binding protein [Streptomyces sp. NP-1717]